MAKNKKNNKSLFGIVVILLAIIGAGLSIKFLANSEVNAPAGSISISAEVVKEEGSIEVYFCQVDDCTGAIVELLSSAENKIHCAIYDLDLEEVIGVLNEKSNKIDVKLFMDDGYFLNLSYAKHDNASPYMHNKFCVVDDAKVFTGSMNPTFNGATKNDNNILIIESGYLARNYEMEFQELWNYGENERTKQTEIVLGDVRIENFFCPDDDCASRVRDLIYTANHTIYFMAFSFTEESIATALALRKNEGIEVKGVFEKRTESKYSKYEFLKFQEADVKFDGNKYTMHHKVFVIDNETVITGSMNPTASGDHRNDENVIVIHNPQIAEWYAEEFFRVWALSDPEH